MNAERAEVGLGDVPDRAQRLRCFADAYGITDREEFLVALVRARTEQLTYIRRWPVTGIEAAEHLRRVAELGVDDPTEHADWTSITDRLR